MNLSQTSLLFLTLLFLLGPTGCKKNNFDIEGSFSDAANAPGEWVFVEDKSMICRDGSSTGMMVRLHPASTKVLIYLQGGGACFNQLTCDENPSFFGGAEATNFPAQLGSSGIFNLDLPDNPFKDYHQIVIPYCTGDIHGGQDPSNDVTNGPKEQFMFGENNVKIALFNIAQHFSRDEPTDIFFTGSSAGGFGVLLNIPQVASTFPDAQITAVNDGGALILKDNVVPPCFQSLLEQEMALDLPEDLNDKITGTWGTGLKGMYEYVANVNPNVNCALISHSEDEVIRYFMGFGMNNCAGNEDLVAGSDFSNGLSHLRDSVFRFLGNWHTYYVNGSGHTFLGNDAGVSTNVAGTALSQWLMDVHAGTATNISE